MMRRTADGSWETQGSDFKWSPYSPRASAGVNPGQASWDRDSNALNAPGRFSAARGDNPTRMGAPVAGKFGGLGSTLTPEEERVARAKEHDFNLGRTLYHGTAGDVKGFDGTTFLTSSPKIASEYATEAARAGAIKSLPDDWAKNFDVSGAIQDVNKAPFWKKGAATASFNKLVSDKYAARDALIENNAQGAAVMPLVTRGNFMAVPEAHLNNAATHQAAKDAGYEGIVSNARDGLDTRDPSDIYAVFDGKNIRSKFAQFKDPSSKDLLASALLGTGVFGAATAGGQDQADAAAWKPPLSSIGKFLDAAKPLTANEQLFSRAHGPRAQAILQKQSAAQAASDAYFLNQKTDLRRAFDAVDEFGGDPQQAADMARNRANLTREDVHEGRYPGDDLPVYKPSEEIAHLHDADYQDRLGDTLEGPMFNGRPKYLNGLIGGVAAGGAAAAAFSPRNALAANLLGKYQPAPDPVARQNATYARTHPSEYQDAVNPAEIDTRRGWAPALQQSTNAITSRLGDMADSVMSDPVGAAKGVGRGLMQFGGDLARGDPWSWQSLVDESGGLAQEANSEHPFPLVRTVKSPLALALAKHRTK